MKVAVVYASKHGFTKGIAEYIRDKVSDNGIQAELVDATRAKAPGEYDAFIIGSVVFFGKWMREAHEFVTRNQEQLSHHPVWLFSSGPTGKEKTDKKGRDLLEASIPTDIAEFKRIINPRNHHVFYGGYDSTKEGGITGWFVRRVPAEQRGLAWLYGLVTGHRASTDHVVLSIQVEEGGEHSNVTA